MAARQSARLERKKFFGDPVMVVTIAVLIALLLLFIVYPLAILLVDSVLVRETELCSAEALASGEPAFCTRDGGAPAERDDTFLSPHDTDKYPQGWDLVADGTGRSGGFTGVEEAANSGVLSTRHFAAPWWYTAAGLPLSTSLSASASACSAQVLSASSERTMLVLSVPPLSSIRTIRRCRFADSL